jgi:predicted DNA-binding WGR domain protein
MIGESTTGDPMTRRFEFKDGSSAKFWEIGVSGGTMTVRFGRIGTDGQTQTKKLGAGAAGAAEKLIGEKTRKGYVEVGAAPRPTPTRSKTDGAITKVLQELDKKLAAYAPAVHGKLAGAKSFKKLEKLVAVPPDLRALWSWADGADELIVTDPAEGSALQFLTVDHAASDMASTRRVVPEFPADLVPFATDGAGNYLAVNAGGQVIDWDHETLDPHVVAPSLEELLRRTIKAIDKKTLFGGPAPKPGKVDPRAKRIEKMLGEPLAHLEEIVELSFRVEPPAERYRVLVAARQAVFAKNPSPEQGAKILKWIPDAAAAAKMWDEALAALADLEKRGGKVESHEWTAIGRMAIEAGAFAAAAATFGKVKGDPEALVGVAIAANRTGKDRGAIERADKAVTREIGSLEKDIAKDLASEGKANISQLAELSWHLNLRAALQQLAGDTDKARATLRDARKRCGSQFDLREMPIALGLKESDAR